MKIKFLVLFLGLICTSVLYAQERQEKGTYEMKVTKIELSPEVGADSTMIMEQLQKQMNSLNYKCVFTKEVVAIIEEVDGFLGKETVRTVHDLVNRHTYFVRDAGYTKDTLAVPNPNLPFESKIISESVLEEKRFGLNQVAYTCLVNQQDTVAPVTTLDIDVPVFVASDAFNMAKKGTITSFVMNIGIASITYEMISFVPEVEDEALISTDFSGIKNLSDTK